MKFKKIILTTIMLSVILLATSCGKEFTVKFDSRGTTVESVVVEKIKQLQNQQTHTKKTMYLFAGS